ncbi:MAG: hypothetical protein ACFFC3_08335 [Candidatus Odinarchaeota archaeon]
MVQVIDKLNNSKILVEETLSLDEIREALECKLYVPDIRVKDKIIDEFLLYLKNKFSDPEYKIKSFIGYIDKKISGIVICQINPNYKSYGRKCGTFGWLSADSFDICKKLLKKCENFIKKNKIRKIRGPINFPKSLGGIGIQNMGFKEKMLYGVAYSNSDSQLISYLESIGYQRESEYTCVYVAEKTWNKGKKIDKNIIFRYFPLRELYEYIEDIKNLANNSLYEILPDTSGIIRIHEFFDTFSKIPKKFYEINEKFNQKNYSEIPQFIETWETCNLRKTEPFAPMAFDKSTDELVGILLGLPDLYEDWAGKAITRCNVDTAMVKKGYFGKGIFSALNNLGQLTTNLYGINYFEGTSIWSNNSRAISTIFPHCDPIRKHYVFQKRI